MDQVVAGPVAVTYEAGPTGFGLARYPARGRDRVSGGGAVEVAAPGRGSGQDRARDARHLARLLHLGEIVAVTVPGVEQEAARDLVRAREDCRGDLMTARHRVSKLLLRQGIVYYGGKAWTGKHELWLRRPALRLRPALQLAYDTAFDAMLATPWTAGIASMRRSPRWPPTRVHPGGDPVGLPARGLDADRVRVGRRDRRLAPVDRPLDRRLPRVGAHRVLLGGDHARRVGSPRPATATPAACWSRRPGTTAPRIGPGAICGAAGTRRPGGSRARGQAANRRLHARWARFDERKKRPVVANAAIARELAGWCWSLAVLDD